MPYGNTSPISVGMTGVLNGATYRVVGRMLMSMEEDGAVYYWNEFNLIGPDDKRALLVHETTGGPQWRLFRLIEPEHPITAAEAAAKRVGDTINLLGDSLRISCVDESRVCEVEGEAPEGVEQGDVASYFNAESGNQMVVVSWTRDEVEVFRGVNLPGYAVLKAFGVKPGAAANRSGQTLNPIPDADEDESRAWKGVLIAGCVVLVIAGIVYWRMRGELGGGEVNAPKTVAKAPRAKYAFGQSGNVDNVHYRISGQALVEVARVNRRDGGHEYTMSDDSENRAVLLQSGKDWYWLKPFTPANPLHPKQAGARRLGDSVDIDGVTMRVTDLFLFRAESSKGSTAVLPGTPLYGFEARQGERTVIVRWGDAGITYYQVTRRSPNELAAFPSK
jgi:hypothetical protein